MRKHRQGVLGHVMVQLLSCSLIDNEGRTIIDIDVVLPGTDLRVGLDPIEQNPAAA